MKDAMLETLGMCFQPGLLGHFLKQDLPVPSAAVICRSRIELDMASCIYAREHLLNPKCKWILHLRCDSSPQGGRDFFVVEYDHCNLQCQKPFVANTPIFELLSQRRFNIENRILPLSVIGARAASSLHKAQKLLDVLSMESANLSVSVSRVYSLLSDYGAESGIWNLPSLEPDEEDVLYRSLKRLLPRALPIADVDHGLHHIMEEVSVSFADWKRFKDLVGAFAKAFGSYHRLNRFRDMCIKKNTHIPEEHRHVFLALFKIVCPSFIDSRWHFLYETLGWIMGRKAALQLLRLDDILQGEQASKTSSEFSLSKSEYEMLRCMQTEGKTAAHFWMMAELCMQLAEWGKWFSVTLHSCPCRCKTHQDDGSHSKSKSKSSKCGRSEASSTSCPMIGRTSVLLASGLPDVAVTSLRQISNSLPHGVQEAISKLQELDCEASQSLLEDFNTAIGRLAFRTEQVFSYWQQLPWALVMVMRPWVERFDSKAEDTWLSRVCCVVKCSKVL